VWSDGSGTATIVFGSATNIGLGKANGIRAVKFDGNSFVETNTIYWTGPTTGGIKGAPIISTDGSTVYALFGKGFASALHAIRLTGPQKGISKWSTPLDVPGAVASDVEVSPVMGLNGTIYLSTDTNLFAVNDLGTSGQDVFLGSGAYNPAPPGDLYAIFATPVIVEGQLIYPIRGNKTLVFLQ